MRRLSGLQGEYVDRIRRQRRNGGLLAALGVFAMGVGGVGYAYGATMTSNCTKDMPAAVAYNSAPSSSIDQAPACSPSPVSPGTFERFGLGIGAAGALMEVTGMALIAVATRTVLRSEVSAETVDLEFNRDPKEALGTILALYGPAAEHPNGLE